VCGLGTGYGAIVALDLFAGIPVSDYGRSLAWYERLLGAAPSFLPNDTEAVWEVGEHRFVFIEVRPEHAGHAMHTLFVDDFDARVRAMADRGMQPAERETYSSGVRKATYRDPDGNEIGFGGGPADAG
jgi:catechol 2,3-dioxygenase-like lactoylglutathione lyase family enzyme